MNAFTRVFGPSRREVWQQLSEAVGGRFVKGGFAVGDKVEVQHGEWTLTLDTYIVTTRKVTIPFTRMRAPFVAASDFRFRVYRKSVFSGIAKRLGMQDIEIGDAPFDEGFIVQGASETRVRRLLSNARIRELIAAQKDIELGVKDDEGWFGSKFPEGVDELYFSVSGIIKDIARLESLFDLFAETLDELHRIGAARTQPPKVTLR